MWRSTAFALYHRERKLPILNARSCKTGLQFKFGAEPSLTMVRREHGFIFSEWASGWELVCWMMSVLSLNALGMPEVYFGDGQGYAHWHTLEFLRKRSAFREKKRR